MNEVIDGKKYSQALRDKVKNFVEIVFVIILFEKPFFENRSLKNFFSSVFIS